MIMKNLFTKQFSFILLFVFALYSCDSKLYQAAVSAADDVESSTTERYGSGSYSDALTGYSQLAPQYSKINKLYDEGKITSSERDSRKRRLNNAYKDYKNKEISYSSYKKVVDEVVNK